MNPKDITTAKNADLRASMAAMQRAAKLARQTAIETNTHIVVVRDGKLIVVDAKTLREEMRNEDVPTP